jgi:DNA repair protein RadC
MGDMIPFTHSPIRKSPISRNLMNYSIRDWPTHERPRERLNSAGASALSTRELLAILIGSGTEARSAVDVAGHLLQDNDGSLRQLSASSAAEMQRVPGVGPAVTARLMAALELGRRMAREGLGERPRIRGPRDIYDICAPALQDARQEEFRVLLLNTQHCVVRELVVTRGTLDASVVHPREVFRAAIIESAAAVILVHNHPSGDPTPSREDREVTDQLVAAGRLIGISVLDHIVIGDGRYVSFVEAGLLTGS